MLNRRSTSRVLICVFTAVFVVSDVLGQVPAEYVHDLALIVSPELPCVWPVGMTPLAVVTTKSLGLQQLRFWRIVRLSRYGGC